MFKHILLPTDGSELSEKAIREGMRFANSIAAKVTGLCVIPLQHHHCIFETAIPKEALEQVASRCKKTAETYLMVIEKAAEESGIACEVVYEVNDRPYEAIVRVADQKCCDLILMASHGRSGAEALLIGSETQKVLTHSKIPVLVYR
jgi:nucleotide-binding universal stress UspA family protein